MIIDTHLHAWLADSADLPWNPLSDVVPSYEWPIESAIAAMDDGGIDGGLLIQPSMYSFDHTYVRSCGRRFPNRLRLMGMVDPRSPSLEADVKELADDGFVGLRLAPMLRPDLPWYNSEQADKLWQAASDSTLILGLLLSPQQMADTFGFLVKYPGTTVIVDHLARPDKMGGNLPKALLDAARFDNVYVKISALQFMSRQPSFHRDAQQWVRQVYDAFGAERLIWGTDTPMSQNPQELATAMDIVDQALPNASSAERAMIMGDTAAKLFGWQHAETARNDD